MTRRLFSILVVLAAVFAAAAIAVTIERQGATASETKPEIVFPGLTARLNDVMKIVAVRDGETATLVRKGTGEDAPWFLVEAGNYPGKMDRIRQALIGMGALETIEPKTKLPNHYAKLQVEDPSKKGAKSGRITLYDRAGKVMADLIVGKPKFSPSGIDAIYIRRPNEERAWLARGRVDVPESRFGWVDTNVLTVDLRRMKKATLNEPGKPSLTVYKNKPDDRDFTIADQPSGTDIKDIFGAEDIARTVQSVNFAAVKPASEMAIPTEGKPWGEFWTFDGLKISVYMKDENGKGWVAFVASPAEDAKVDDKVKTEIADINKRLSPWRFELGDFEYKELHKTMQDLVEPKQASADQPAPKAK